MNDATTQAKKQLNTALETLEREFVRQVNETMSFTPYQMAEHLTKKDSGRELKEIAKIITKLNSVYQDLNNL